MTDIQTIATITLNPAIDQTVSIPGFRAGQVNRLSRSESHPGGKGVNVASFLSDYGLKTAVAGFLGRENPQSFEALFSQKGMDDRFVRIDGETRTGIKIVDEVSRETTDINFPGAPPSSGDIRALFDVIEALTAEYEWFALAGSIPAEAPGGIYGDLIRLIRSKGRSTALDASGEGLRLALPAAPTLVKPNIHELEELLGRTLTGRAEIVDAARRLLDEGVRCVVVSMGEKGAVFVEDDQQILALPPDVTVESTVGAGDAMVSGTIAGKVKGLPLADCARLATAFSASAVSRVRIGLPPAEDLEALMKQVVLETL